MRIALTAALLLAVTACSDDGGGGDPGVGPKLGYWTLDLDGASTGWSCFVPVVGGADCAAPAPFAPMPTDLRIGGGGRVEWIDAVDHDGDNASVEGCVLVGAAREFAHDRGSYSVCNVRNAMDVPNPDLVAASITWDADTANACRCIGLFDFVGE